MPEADDRERDPEIPDWDDEYLDRVAHRLRFNYDLEKAYAVHDETFDLYARLLMESKKHFMHQSVTYGNHESREHLFVRRVDSVSQVDLERLVALGHDLADEWIDPDEEHYGTDFSFVLVAPGISDDVRSFVSGFRDRTLLKFGYYGHYEINLVVVVPEAEDAVASKNADVVDAVTTWEDVPEQSPGFFGRLARKLGR
ncbi:hypothetical protein [Haloarchaeobius sp. DFWS5]|uniref:hypothetical protein n=1 Tax=Haloarchaeobius sp. DFWS5 TaxID=3446114 RepID=UPI003EBBACAB